MVEFVNPYTMVPSAPPGRGAPPGHDSLGRDRLAGWIELTITARTPLLLGHREDGGAPALLVAPDGSVVIPGSSLHGAVRSLHETLAGGCLRVLAATDVPVHRDPAAPVTTAGDRFAVVDRVDAHGRPVTVRLCDERTAKVVHGVVNGHQRRHGSRTGDRFNTPRGAEPDADVSRLTLVPGLGREVPEDGAASEGRLDTWVLLVTDTKARNAKKPCSFRAGRLTSVRAEVTDQAWERYRHEVAGSDDLRTAVLQGSEPTYTPDRFETAEVPWRGVGIGYRLRAREYLHLGQPVWVRLDSDGNVDRIKLSQLWRTTGEYSAVKRAGDLAPCTNPEDLCQSCRVFGSADTTGRQDGDASWQRGYRGHVRFADARATGPVDPQTETLAPLSTPRPSAGQFYLDNTGRGLAASRKENRPLAHWGSEADEGKRGPRPLKGRKYYWRTSAPLDDPYPRGRAREHHSDRLTQQVALVPEGTTFTTRVTFEGLDRAELGSLLAALDPRRLAALAGLGEDRSVVTSVGGGKPFGFGAVDVDLTRLEIIDPRSRYLGLPAPEPPPEAEECLSAFATTVGEAVREVWPGLCNALTVDYVDRELVWYPPGKSGSRGSREFDEGYLFWQRTNGTRLGRSERRILPMPDPAASPEHQILDSAPPEHYLPDQGNRGRGGPGPQRPKRGGNR